jgi:hypothetical protein
MKKVLALVLISIMISANGCRKTYLEPAPAPIVLGNKSTTMNIISQPIVVGSNLELSVNVTPGSKYSFQITNMKGDVLVTKGLASTTTTEKVLVSIEKIPVGAYDLLFIDTDGNEIKTPIIIK